MRKADIGLSGDDFTVNFTWTDNVHDEGQEGVFSGDILDFYISGDVAPGGRFKYSYISTRENARGPETETVTDTATEPVTTADPVTGTETDPATGTGTDAETTGTASGGCRSLMAGAPVLLALGAIAAVLPMRRRRR